MTSWSYQSTNPCTVLVKEKQDGQSPNCSPPITQSSTESAVPAQDQPEISSSLGNSVGGKKRRAKRQAHDEDGVVNVVFDGDGHDYNPPNESVEKRILVNISIAMDGGLGTMHQEVYQLQVAVPLPKEARKSQKFYAYNVATEAQEPPEELSTDDALVIVDDKFEEILTTTDEVFSTLINESPTTVTDDDFNSSTTVEGLKN